MLKINQVIIVEGKYDKIKLSSFINATIIATDGFKIYKDKEKIKLLQTLAKKYGAIILTDSDVAGFKIRNFLSNILNHCEITHIYIPEILGKEKRKSTPSKEGTLGVEGINKNIIISALKSANVLNNNIDIKHTMQITKQHLFQDGLIGAPNSSYKREQLKSALKLPRYLSTKALIELLNRLLTYNGYKNILKNLMDWKNL